MKYLITVFFSTAIFSSTLSQSEFKHLEQLHTQKFTSTTPLCITDIDGDLMDDVVILDKGNHLFVLYQRLQNEAYEVEDLGQVGIDLQWSIVAADLDNDGRRDIVVAGAYDGVKVYFQRANSWILSRISLPKLWSQAMNAVDINVDGWTDLFICNDVGHNVVLMNESGILREDTMMFRDLPVDSAAGNYGSLWSDFDLDGDIDLYLAKCFAFADSKNDVRRINRLYRNDNGTFSEVANDYNINSGAQSWTGDFVDMDNDGDFDCFVTNHDVPALLWEKNGAFNNITQNSNLAITGSVMQSLFFDFDADGWRDVFIAGARTEYYNNNQNKTFKNNFNPFEKYYFANSLATGDLNFDGHLDLYASYPNLITGPSTLGDKFWINQTTENGTIEVYLHAINSNPDGIGTLLKLYGTWGTQMIEVRAGESYGIMNSLTQRFGLGKESSADSLIIQWPSGMIDKIYDLKANKYVVVVEGQHSIVQDDMVERLKYICPIEFVTLYAPKGYAYEWSTGEQSDSIVVSNEGFYQVFVLDTFGNTITLPGYQVLANPEIRPEISIKSGNKINCKGTQVILESNIESDLTWNTGSTESMITVNRSGNYHCQAKGYCKDFLSNTIDISFKDNGMVNNVGHDTIPKGNSATLYANGDSIVWYETETSDSIIAKGDMVTIDNVISDTSLWAAGQNVTQFNAIKIGADTTGLFNEGRNANRIIFFEVHDDLIFESITVFADTSGLRRILIQSPQSKELLSLDYHCQKGKNVIPLNLFIPQAFGLFKITTDQDFNLQERGNRAPGFLSINQNLNYPYGPDNLLQIIHSSFSTNNFNYFFDWQIRKADLICEGERREVWARLDTSTSSYVKRDEQLSFWPNPAENSIYFSNHLNGFIKAYDLNGILLKSIKINTNKIDLTGLPSGLLIIKYFGKQEYRRCLVLKL